jgi:hypothetical protein
MNYASRTAFACCPTFRRRGALANPCHRDQRGADRRGGSAIPSSFGAVASGWSLLAARASGAAKVIVVDARSGSAAAHWGGHDGRKHDVVAEIRLTDGAARGS